MMFSGDCIIIPFELDESSSFVELLKTMYGDQSELSSRGYSGNEEQSQAVFSMNSLWVACGFVTVLNTRNIIARRGSPRGC